MATKRKSKKHSSNSKHSKSEDFISKAALKLINQASSLLRQVVIESSKQGAKGRAAFKKKASTLVGAAAKCINQAVEKSSYSLRKGIKKL